MRFRFVPSWRVAAALVAGILAGSVLMTPALGTSARCMPSSGRWTGLNRGPGNSCAVVGPSRSTPTAS
jgi:hypothetical protein